MSDLPKPPLHLTANRRYLVDSASRPFLYLADTAWSIVWKGNPEEWGAYLDHRTSQGFSALQVNLLPWRWEMADSEGNHPFLDATPSRPNDAYFSRFDQFLSLAAERSLFTCLMLIWGGPRPSLPAVHFSTEQAVAFARYAVARFGHFPMLWSLSGDAEYVQELAKWEAVGAAVEAADTYQHPTTNHLPPQMNWRFLHADASWHDFFMIQTGHTRRSIGDMAALPLAYYHRQPPKAFVNGEPWYENHPSRDIAEVYGPPFGASEARYAFWVSVLSGATMGHTYGAQGIWNWKHPGDDETEVAGPQIGPPWFEALHYPGAAQCGIGARYLRTLPWWRLQPCPERVQLGPPPSDDAHGPFCAHIPDERFLVYLPETTSRAVVKGLDPTVDWQAHWMDPQTGETQPLERIDVRESGVWQAPAAPTDADWVLSIWRR